jgi:hypothetical protein
VQERLSTETKVVVRGARRGPKEEEREPKRAQLRRASDLSHAFSSSRKCVSSLLPDLVVFGFGFEAFPESVCLGRRSFFFHLLTD